MEYTTIRDALHSAGYTHQDVASELSRALHERGGKTDGVSPRSVLSWYAGHRRWPDWAVAIVYTLLKRRLEPVITVEIDWVKRLCALTSEEIGAANAKKREH